MNEQETAAVLKATPECMGSQTVGPYYGIGMTHLVSGAIAGASAAGRHVKIAGTLHDWQGTPVPDAILELWQADATGRYSTQPYHPAVLSDVGFTGFARLSTHDGGRFAVSTVVPGPVPFPDGRLQAPHIVVILFMRGLLRHLVTRMYFAGEELNAHDPVLATIAPGRRPTLMATPDVPGSSQLTWNIYLQGEHETVFFAS